MLFIHIKHGRVVDIEAMNGTEIIVPDRPHIEGVPDSILLKNDEDYVVLYLDEIEKEIAEAEAEE